MRLRRIGKKVAKLPPRSNPQRHLASLGRVLIPPSPRITKKALRPFIPRSDFRAPRSSRRGQGGIEAAPPCRSAAAPDREKGREAPAAFEPSKVPTFALKGSHPSLYADHEESAPPVHSAFRLPRSAFVSPRTGRG